MKPAIRELVPSFGPVGTEVTILGVGFGDSPAKVSFNSVLAEGAVAEAKTAAGVVKSPKATTTKVSEKWTDTVVVVKVPAGATPGDVVVTVDGVESNGSHFTVTV